MRRRRQKNPLLMRIVVISVAVHVVALPVLAHFGAFKKIQQHFVETRMVVLPPPSAPEKEKAEVKKQVAQKPSPTAKKGPANTAHSHQGPKTNPNAPHIALAQGAGDDSGNTAEQGTGKQGVLPPPPTDPRPPVTQDTTPPPPDKPKTDTQTVKTTSPPIKDPTPPSVKPVTPVEPAPPVKPHDPVFTEATVLSQPQPTIPDELRSEALSKNFVAEFTVGTDGMPAEIKVAQSTGNRELDRIALDTAKRWRFKPATRDGQPIESRVRLHIEFQVN